MVRAQRRSGITVQWGRLFAAVASRRAALHIFVGQPLQAGRHVGTAGAGVAWLVRTMASWTAGRNRPTTPSARTLGIVVSFVVEQGLGAWWMDEAHHDDGMIDTPPPGTDPDEMVSFSGRAA